MMKIRLVEIPKDGLKLDFPLEQSSLNSRLEAERLGENGSSNLAPEISFESDAEAAIKVTLNGRTVEVAGRTRGSFQTLCSRCADTCSQKISSDLRWILKPESERPANGKDPQEGVSFSYYEGEEFDCSDFLEESLLLSIPYSVLCSESCKGLCPSCGASRNNESCSCSETPLGDDRFAILRDLKVNA